MLLLFGFYLGKSQLLQSKRAAKLRNRTVNVDVLKGIEHKGIGDMFCAGFYLQTLFQRSEGKGDKTDLPSALWAEVLVAVLCV